MYPRDVDQVLRAYGITDPAVVANLHKLMRDGRKKGWWQLYRDTLSPAALDFVRLEWDASTIRNFQPIVVPGLLQTADYARAVMETEAEFTPLDVNRLLAIRMSRQKILKRDLPPRVQAVLGETALRQVIGGQHVMRAQAHHLLAVGTQPNVDLRVLPFSAGAHVGTTGAFLVLHFSEVDFSVVLLEHLTNAMWVERDEDVRCYDEAFEYLQRLVCP